MTQLNDDTKAATPVIPMNRIDWTVTRHLICSHLLLHRTKINNNQRLQLIPWWPFAGSGHPSAKNCLGSLFALPALTHLENIYQIPVPH